MIVMSVKLDNFYSFQDFKIKFSYPRKLKDSKIEYEYLENIPTFKFKKLNIIMGTNSSGKTTFGKMLLNIFNYISTQNISVFENTINNKGKESVFEIDIVLKSDEEYNLFRLNATLSQREKLEIEKLELWKAPINKNGVYEKVTQKLKLISEYVKDRDKKEKIENILEEINNLGWFFNFTSLNKLNKKIKNLKVASNILKTFDNSIECIKEVENTENGYQIIFNNRDSVLLQNGKVADCDVLSSGTEEALGIIYSIDQMIQLADRPFYIDEKFSHAHSELEKAILSIMIELIGKESQLFFTTHNIDILNMDVPVHSFTFLTKEKQGEIKVVYPENKIKRNDRVLINHVKNNMFDTMPKDELIYDILEMVNKNE